MVHTCIIAATRYEFLRSLKRTLEPDLEVVAMVDNLMSLRDSMVALEPDLVVVDLALLGRSPGKLVSVVRSRAPEVGLIVLVEEDDPRSEEGVRAAGVDRTVLRSRAGSELVVVAHEVLGPRKTHEAVDRETLHR